MMNNTDRHPECYMRTVLGNCDPIGGFCTSVNESVCEALHKVSRLQGEWVLDPNGMDWNIPAWRCSRCGFVANYIGVEANGLGRNPMHWAGSNYCPNCGARMKGTTDGNK